MKHSFKILMIFMALFVLSQVLGLYLLSLSVQEIVQTPEGPKVVYSNTTIGERPQVEGYGSIIYIAIGVIIGTVMLLIIAKYNKILIWKIWFFVAAWLTMSISIGVMLNVKLAFIAWILAAILALVKMKYPHPIMHNLTELLMYAGITLLLAPILTVPIAIILLVLISIYDAYAVWKSKHMITMAEFTKKSNLFPGLAITYKQNKDKTIILTSPAPDKSSKILKDEHKVENKSTHKSSKKDEAKTGILGGGDIVFPLLFAGSAFTMLIEKGHSVLNSVAYSSLISLGAAVALFLLFVYGKQDKFYPAMPFITAGCLAGYGVMNLLLLI